MELWQIIILSVVALIIIGAVTLTVMGRRRSLHLRQHFGPEYERTVSELGNRRAEADLAQREARVRKMQIRTLTQKESATYAREWERCQAQFVDQPAAAVLEADRLISDIMRARGYPVTEPDEQAADISAAYPNHVAAYRDARQVVSNYGRGHASTEDLRKALVQYRALFDELLGGRDEELRRAS